MKELTIHCKGSQDTMSLDEFNDLILKIKNKNTRHFIYALRIKSVVKLVKDYSASEKEVMIKVSKYIQKGYQVYFNK